MNNSYQHGSAADWNRSSIDNLKEEVEKLRAEVEAIKTELKENRNGCADPYDPIMPQ